MSKPYEVVTLLRDFQAQAPFREIMCISLAHAAFSTRASHVNTYDSDENAYEFGGGISKTQ